MYDPPKKRLLTDIRQENATSADQILHGNDNSTDVTNDLRNVGARVRHSVSTGYRTSPSGFVKAQSTGTIFRSMKDTLYAAHAELSNHPQHFDLSKKRSLSEESEGGDGEKVDKSPSSVERPISARPIKPLRHSTASLFPQSVERTEKGKVIEEEDWSLDMPRESAEQQFESMEL